MGIKHQSRIKKPRDYSLRQIGKIPTAESRRSVSIIKMSAIKEKMGPYWDDVSFRRIVFQWVPFIYSLLKRTRVWHTIFRNSRLCLMGRMLVYGGNWDLPEAPHQDNHFREYLITNVVEPVYNETDERQVNSVEIIQNEDNNLTP